MYLFMILDFILLFLCFVYFFVAIFFEKSNALKIRSRRFSFSLHLTLPLPPAQESSLGSGHATIVEPSIDTDSTFKSKTPQTLKIRFTTTRYLLHL